MDGRESFCLQLKKFIVVRIFFLNKFDKRFLSWFKDFLQGVD